MTTLVESAFAAFPSPAYLACGHAATASRLADRQPLCAMCSDLAPTHAQRLAEVPDLSYRTAVCLMCQAERDSDLRLPFFKHTPLFPFDSFYCGCEEGTDSQLVA